jgi:hypothetical protein
MSINLSYIYCGWVFLAGIGVLQASAAFNGLHGLLFFPKKSVSYFFAILTAGIGLAVLFSWNWLYCIGVIQGHNRLDYFS